MFKQNHHIKDLQGLDVLNTIGVNLSIDQNDSLLTLSGLEALKSINGSLEIKNNKSLIDLSSLLGLNASAGINIFANDLLPSLYGLNNIDPFKIDN